MIVSRQITKTKTFVFMAVLAILQSIKLTDSLKSLKNISEEVSKVPDLLVCKFD